MQTIQLNGTWKMRASGEVGFVDAAVPGTVLSTLEANGLIPDPYYRDNEDLAMAALTKDYEFSRTFSVSDTELNFDSVSLICEGLDVLAEISINGTVILHADNMHRTYRIDVKSLLHVGENSIFVRFGSTAKWVAEHAKDSVLPSVLGHTGLEQLRVAQCVLGWDWGPCLPDMGIWRNIFIRCADIGEIENILVRQHHCGVKVSLDVSASITQWQHTFTALRLSVDDPSGKRIYDETVSGVDSRTEKITVDIPSPQLWWPQGYGDQPLYRVKACLLSGETVVSEKSLAIGLRTIVHRQEEDAFGQGYFFEVNGVSIFIRGSNLITEDAVLARRSKERMETLLESCKLANFNCVRVWGGAYYPEDYFFDICDRLGLLVYQDFMFACHLYPATESFLKNVAAELEDNIRRIRHHACLAIWSGNNEIETIYGLYTGHDPMFAPLCEALQQYLNFKAPDEAMDNKLQQEYLQLFDSIIPEALQRLDPDTPYVRSSPCSKNQPFMFISHSYTRGDTHYYINMDSMLPMREQRKYFFRFVSEMGFQSFPDMKTVKSFALAEDEGANTPVMLKHQKSGGGNQVIEAYMASEFSIPQDLSLYIYASQITAGEVLRYSIEHMRRNRGRCMGVLTWQLNDCWPAISWAGMDYNGRWKAQQYYSKRMFAPLLLSAEETNSTADIYISNDTLFDISGEIRWALRDAFSNSILEGSVPVTVEKLTAASCLNLDFEELLPNFDPQQHYLEYTLISGSKTLAYATTIFTEANKFRFEAPSITMAVAETEDSFVLSLNSAAYCRQVALMTTEVDCIFSDNFFDMSAGSTKTVSVCKKTLSKKISREAFAQQLTVKSVYDLQMQE